MSLLLTILLWTALALVALGALALFSPWTYGLYVWLFPSELTNPAYDGGKGGPYPELLGIPITLAGLALLACWAVARSLLRARGAAL